MPYKSKAQEKKFHILEKEGKISPATVKEWDKASKGKKLPAKKGGGKVGGPMFEGSS